MKAIVYDLLLLSVGIIIMLLVLNIFYVVFVEEPFNSYLRNFCIEYNESNISNCYSNHTIQELVNYVDMIKIRS